MGIWPFKTNFSLIAENTTKLYMELKGRYKERFPDDASLLATAGVLDTRNYNILSLSPQIDITDIIELARRCTAKDGDYIPIRESIQYSDNIQRYRDHKSSAADLLSFEYSKGPHECTDEVFDFVFGLELLIFNADNNKFSPFAIEEACRRKYKTIEKAIAGTINKYNVGKGIFARATTTFMEDVSLQAVRNSLGILQ